VAGSRLFGDRDLDDNGAVANAERSALLATEDYAVLDEEAGAADSPGVTDTIHAVDPTQRLLTALGRFQRQVVKAEKGLPQSEWCDECMNQLITGIEIAYDQDWPDVQQALTDTARVLHSYEQARLAEQCVPFLQDSYEILCLMVGDLIVDNVRSGVMLKWQERYRIAVEELAEGGIELVEDDEDEDELPEAGQLHSEAPARAVTPPVVETPSAEAADPFGDEAFQPAADEEEAFFMTPEPLSEPAHGPEPMEEWIDEAAIDAPDFSPAPATATAPDDEPFVVEEFDEESQLPPLDEVLEEVDAASTPGEAIEIDAPQADEAVVQEDDQASAISAQEFEEVDDAYDDEADEYIVEPLSPPVAAAPVEAAPADDGTPDALLQTIRRAFAAGNVAEAKVFAMQVAADMAQLEADRAEERRALKQRLLEENADAIAAGENQVNAAESGVAEAESRVQEREQDQGSKRMEIEALRTQSAEHESEIASLDEQIRQLQAQREAEERRLRGVQEDLERALAEDSRLQTDIESLHDALDSAQHSLSAAQALVARLREERGEEEIALAEAEDTLAEHRRAVNEIQRTIAAISGKPIETPAPEMGEVADGESPADGAMEGAEGDAEAAEEEAVDDGQISLLEHLEKEEAHARTKGKAKDN
jgi:hypothetical protein